MKKQDIKIRWSKKEDDFLTSWEAGCKRDARMVMGELLGVVGDSTLIKELKDRGYDMKTLRFSISKVDYRMSNPITNPATTPPAPK